MVDPTFNPQNDRYICFYDSTDEEDEDEEAAEEAAGDVPAAAAVLRPKFVARSKHPASAMFLGAIASTGEVSPQYGSLQALDLILKPILRP